MTDGPAPNIKVTKNGPYLVTGGVPISVQEIVVDDAGESVAWRETSRLPERASCALCRCGESGAKPNCDGSHMLVHFDGTETASHTSYEQASDVLPGPRVDLRDELDLCAEARFCAAKGGIWHAVERDDEESAQAVVDVAAMCPSGRYTPVEHDGGRAVEPELAPAIVVVQDPSQRISGPLWAQGGIPVESSDGSVYEVRNRVTLCRCGGSKNKPFCDGTHVDVGFNDAD